MPTTHYSSLVIERAIIRYAIAKGKKRMLHFHRLIHCTRTYEDVTLPLIICIQDFKEVLGLFLENSFINSTDILL